MLTVKLILLLVFIALLIIFQPEIRRWVKHLGRVKLLPVPFITGEVDPDELAIDITQIILAVKELAKNKFGALIVIEPPEADHEYVIPGTQINGDISSNLLLSIFFPKSPLHDGAVIIQKDKIKAAGVILPITDNRKLSHVYGTRHRAALGLSEVFDCLCIAVSEESGSISMAYHGQLIPFEKAEELSDYLSQFYSQLQITVADHRESTNKSSIKAHINSDTKHSDNLPQAADA